jgi:predicted naringenin-chalcone synthase
MAYLESIGTAVPKGEVLQGQAMRLAHSWSGTNERVLHRLYSQSGVEKRHSVLAEGADTDFFFQPAKEVNDFGPRLSDRMKLFEEYAGVLAEESSRDALHESRYAASEITHLLCVSCTGFIAPGISHHLIKELGLSPYVARVDIGFMGCHAAINALRVAASMVDADTSSKVLLVCTELCTLHGKYQPNAEQEVANSLFGDGSAAAIVHADEEYGGLGLTDFFSMLVPDTHDLMSWRIGDHSFEMGLSPHLPKIIEKELKHFLEAKMSSAYTLSDIEEYVVHPGGRKIVQAVEQALSLSSQQLDDTWSVLKNYGNMSSATVLFILKKVMKKDLAKGTPILMLAFGPGICIESAVLFR